MPTKTRINGQNYTQLPRLVSDDVILKGLPNTPGAPAGYGDLASAVNDLYREGNSIVFPLDIPTPDGLPSVTHPSVIYAEGGWNGYKYWMGFTPYPGGSRENACLVASNDKKNWIVPNGLTNPIIPKPSGTYNTGSDTDIIFSQDGSTMILIHRIYGLTGEQILRTESTDGVNWSEPVAVLTTSVPSGTDLLCLSPTLTWYGENQLAMYSVNKSEAAADRLERRTSTDAGFTWSAPVTCSFPAFSGDYSSHELWHADVYNVLGKYYLLANTDSTLTSQGANTYRLFYLTSDDGIAFTGDTSQPAVPLSGYSFDRGFGHYKSGWIPSEGSPLLWDVFVSGLSDADPVVLTDTEWRIAYYPSMDLAAEGPVFERIENLEDLIIDRIWIPANNFISSTGSPTLGTSAGGRFPSWLMDAATNEQVNASFVSTRGWAKYVFDIYWCNAGAGTGDVQWTLTVSSVLAGGSLSTGDAGRNATATALSQNNLVVTQVGYSNAFGFSEGINHIRVLRSATSPNDTLANDCAFIGVMMTRFS